MATNYKTNVLNIIARSIIYFIPLDPRAECASARNMHPGRTRTDPCTTKNSPQADQTRRYGQIAHDQQQQKLLVVHSPELIHSSLRVKLTSRYKIKK